MKAASGARPSGTSPRACLGPPARIDGSFTFAGNGQAAPQRGDLGARGWPGDEWAQSPRIFIKDASSGSEASGAAIRLEPGPDVEEPKKPAVRPCEPEGSLGLPRGGAAGEKAARDRKRNRRLVLETAAFRTGRGTEGQCHPRPARRTVGSPLVQGDGPRRLSLLRLGQSDRRLGWERAREAGRLPPGTRAAPRPPLVLPPPLSCKPPTGPTVAGSSRVPTGLLWSSCSAPGPHLAPQTRLRPWTGRPAEGTANPRQEPHPHRNGEADRS